MTKLFSPDSLPMRFMSRVADLLLLNLLFLLSCVPVVTVGAALQGLYRVCFLLEYTDPKVAAPAGGDVMLHRIFHNGLQALPPN